jgi:hypothetical protein
MLPDPCRSAPRRATRYLTARQTPMPCSGLAAAAALRAPGGAPTGTPCCPSLVGARPGARQTSQAVCPCTSDARVPVGAATGRDRARPCSGLAAAAALRAPGGAPTGAPCCPTLVGARPGARQTSQAVCPCTSDARVSVGTATGRDRTIVTATAPRCNLWAGPGSV